MILVGLSEQDANFTQSINGGIVQLGTVDFISLFNQIASGGFVKTLGGGVSAVFVQTTDGKLYWDDWAQSPNNSTPETWVQIVPTGGTWTEINASGTIDTWTQKVV